MREWKRCLWFVAAILPLIGCGASADHEGPGAPAPPGGDPGSGSGGAGGTPGGSEHVFYDPANPCRFSLDRIIDDLENDYALPTWEMLDCFTEGISRSRPAFFKRLLSVGDLPGIGPDGGPKQQYVHIEFWDKLWNEHDVNVSSYMFGTMGPYRTNEMVPITYPLYPDHLDAVMRKNFAAALREKRSGKPIVIAQFVPPDDDQDGIVLAQTAEEFKDWNQRVWIPWHVELAKGAERIKADYFAAAGELEALFQRQTVLLSTLTPEQQVELVQWQIDALRDAVRPHFNGVMFAYSYARYAAWGDHWQNVSYAGYDEIAFPLLPECDEATLHAYMQEQLGGYARIVERSGNIPWRVSELDLIRKNFEGLCGTDFTAREADLYRAAFESLDASPMPAPAVGVNIGTLLVESDAAWQVIDEFFASR